MERTGSPPRNRWQGRGTCKAHALVGGAWAGLPVAPAVANVSFRCLGDRCRVMRPSPERRARPEGEGCTEWQIGPADAHSGATWAALQDASDAGQGEGVQ